MDRSYRPLSLIEITSSPSRTTHRSLAQVEFMLDRVIADEGGPDIVQLSRASLSRAPAGVAQ